MKPALRIVSMLTLVTLAAAIVGQILIYAVGIRYGPSGQPINPTPLNVVLSNAAPLGGIIAMPLAFAAFILGLVATITDYRPGWVAAVAVAGVIAVVGLVTIAWVLLSVASPIAFQTPLLAIPLVTTLYSVLAAPRTQRRSST
jgi:hypothetical protein